MAPDARIPAWKRLGLKLVGSKRPAEEAFPDENALQRTTDSTKDPTVNGKSPASKKRKAVRFSSESKAKDGSTSEHLLDGFIKSQQGVGDQFTPEEASQFTTKPPKKPKSKPQGKGKKPKTQKQPPKADQPSTPAYVTY